MTKKLVDLLRRARDELVSEADYGNSRGDPAFLREIDEALHEEANKRRDNRALNALWDIANRTDMTLEQAQAYANLVYGSIVDPECLSDNLTGLVYSGLLSAPQETIFWDAAIDPKPLFYGFVRCSMNGAEPMCCHTGYSGLSSNCPEHGSSSSE